MLTNTFQQADLKAEWIPHGMSTHLMLTEVIGINSPRISREERGVGGKTRVMFTAREADCGRGTEHAFQGK